ncbi:MAG: twin-arginine translocation signal domain-containing protein [Gemmatimonadetes bacterium]|nr:twin-arginine translocation signal domain-containing protein [Gemmatimonadota bacterium]
MPRSEQFTRRQFVATTAMAVGSATLSACDPGLLAPTPDSPDLRPARARTAFGYADESGVRDADGYFVVGLLQTADPQPHLDVIADLRQGHRYLREFR